MNKKLYLTVATIGAVGYGLLAGQGAFAKTAVHTAFEDERFYQCVVTAYNNKEGETKDYQTDILTDAELLKVTSLDCSKNRDTEEAQKIADTSGLEKLTNLTSLNLKYNQIEEIDLSANTKLVELNLQLNKLNSLDISNNTDLQILNLEEEYLTTEDPNDVRQLDISNNPKLEQIVAKDAMLISDIKPAKDGEIYKMDLSSLKFITTGAMYVNRRSTYDYDANNFIVSIPDIQRVNYIELGVTPSSNALTDTYLKLSVDKTGLNNNPNQNEDNDDEGNETSGTGSTESDDEKPKTAESKTKEDLKVPDTGNITNDDAVSKLMPIILPATIAAVVVIACLLKVTTRKRVKF